MKASQFLARRNELLTALRNIDAEIMDMLGYRASKRALDRARELFSERRRVAAELEAMGVEIDDHPAVEQMRRDG